MRTPGKRIGIVVGLSVVALGIMASSASMPRARATQDQATPPGGPCAVVLAGGTPVVEHVSPGQSAFDPNSPEQAGETGNAADYPFDLVFIDAMIAHHDGAVAMAGLALGASERPEIRELATGIIATQGAEIESLLEWRLAWYPEEDPVPANVVTGLTDEGMMTAGGMGGMGQGSMASDTDLALSRLCVPDGPFDLAFLEEMVPHHQGAIGMARLAADRAEHPELIELATAIVAGQEAEIARMTGWLAEWYPSGRAGSMGEVESTTEGTPAP